MAANPLDPSVMLATSMHAQPGVYALLLGSGVSTGAGIPTGWGVVKELVRRVAAASGGEQAATDASGNPESWWHENVGSELGYSTLLQALAPTAAARQGVLAEFFEPTDQDREEGVKVPSRAHHAIAQLVKSGLVRVIITTNFDRLTEQALEVAGVAPQVITRPEAVNGMAPLAHAPATVIKLHGDYKDLGTRNTPEELRDYPDEWNNLLHQVFDEYGLVIAGWSADWDTALVAALNYTSNRRYPLYWDSRSSKGETAQRLLANRQANTIQSTGADEMFNNLTASLNALERLAQPPLTTAMAEARLKRYLPDPLRRIDLHDLLMDQAERVAEATADLTQTSPTFDGPSIQELWEGQLELVTPLTRLLVTGIWHDPTGTHNRLWVDVLQRIVDAATPRLTSITSGLEYAMRWPALIATTAAGVAATRRGHDQVIIDLATNVQGRPQMGTGPLQPAAQLLHPNRLLDNTWVEAMPRWNGGRWLYPASHTLKADIRRFLTDLIPNDADYNEALHGYEYRLGLIHEHQQDAPGAYRALSGEYVGETGWSYSNPQVPLTETAFLDAVERAQQSPWPAFLQVTNNAALGNKLEQHRSVLEPYRRWG